MALTQISDVKFDPEIYLSYRDEESVISKAFLDSGILQMDADLNARADGPSALTTIPSWNPLDSSSEPNYSDDTENEATPDKIDTRELTARNAYINNAWKSADLVKELNASEPMRAIERKTAIYWQEQQQKRIIAMMNGIIADNANDSDDMTNDIAIEAGNSATSANLISRAAFTKTVFTNGDRYDNFGTIAMHSVVFNRLVDQDDIAYIKDSAGTLNIPTYMGLRVIVSDQCPRVAGSTNGFKYTSILFGGAAIGMGVGSPKVPVETERLPLEGNGGGTEVLIERHTWLLHPYGFDFTSSSVAGRSATLAELANAANWNRVKDRKNIPLAFLVTNG